MWILVHVVKGSKYFEASSRVGNQVLISDSSDLVIAGRALGQDGYRFEARSGNENFVVSEFPGIGPEVSLVSEFTAFAQRIGAVSATGDA